MRILLTNDDGYKADGINYLKEYLVKNNYEYKISAPQKEMSAQSSSLSHKKYIHVEELDDGIAVGGTPADSIIVGGEYLYDDKPDMVFSGINHGPNLGTAIIYSGTVAAAIAASIGGVKAAAFSTGAAFDIKNISKNFEYYLDKAVNIALSTKLIKNTILNFNIPLDNIIGIKVTPMAVFSYNSVLIKHEQHDNHFLISGSSNYVPNENHDNDMEHFLNGYMTITPIQYDMTNYSYINELKAKYETLEL